MIPLAAALLALAPQGFTSSSVSFESKDTLAALRDLNHDGRFDLISIESEGLRVRFQRADGTFAEEVDTDFSWPSRPLGWDLIDWEGDGNYELACLTDSASIQLWRTGKEGHFEKAETLLEDVGSFLPPGIRRLQFARDINGDGALDLVVPSGSSFRIYLRDEQGEFQTPHEVNFEAEIAVQVGDPRVLDSRIGQDVKIPWFRVEDFDGDGRLDLVSETEDRADFFLASPELPNTPTWTLDLESLRAGIKKKEEFDFDDLISNLTPEVRWRTADIDGQAPYELVVQLSDTLKVYKDGTRRGIQDAPAKILRASGPILYFFIRNVTGDELPELQVVRSETLSLGRVLRWLILPGKLDFDLYTYRNESGEYQRQPWKRTTFQLEIPRLLSIEERVEELEDEFTARNEIPARLFALDDDGLSNDIIDADVNGIRCYANQTPEGFREDIPGLSKGDFDRMIEYFFLEDMDSLEDGGKKKFGIDDLFQLEFSRGYELRTLCSSAEPTYSVPLAIPTDMPWLLPYDFTGDGAVDIVVWGRDENEVTHIQFLARKR